MISRAEIAKRNQVVKDALRRFPTLPLMTIARHIKNTHGPLFENDLEKIRNSVRHFSGSMGDENRQAAADKSLFRTGGPVKMPKTWRQIRTSYRLPVGTWLFLADLHSPFHEPKAIEAAISYAQASNVTGLFINGDLQDCSAISFWRSAHRDFNGEVECTLDLLDFLCHEFEGKKIVYKPANHEYRLPSYYMSHAPDLALSPLACMETILGFEQRGIEYLDYYQIVQAGKLPVIHGHEVPRIDRSVNPARGLFLKAKTFSLCAHCHTTSQHTARDLKGNLITTWSMGCMCDLSPDYNPYANDWNWGFAIVNVEKDGGFEVDNRRILPNGKVV